MVQISDAELFEELQRLAAELDRTPSRNDMAEHGAYSAKTYAYRFGSWNEAVEAAGLAPNVRVPRSGSDPIPEADLCDALRELAAEKGTSPSTVDMTTDGLYSLGPYLHRFGSWSEALDAAGLAPRSTAEVGSNVSGPIPTTELLSELARLGNELGETPTVNEMDANGAFSAMAYFDRFGSWNAAVEAAGFDPNQVGGSTQISRDDLLLELVVGREALGRWPTYREMDAYGEYSPATYASRFGSWEAAKQAAAEAMEQYSP